MTNFGAQSCLIAHIPSEITNLGAQSRLIAHISEITNCGAQSRPAVEVAVVILFPTEYNTIQCAWLT